MYQFVRESIDHYLVTVLKVGREGFDTKTLQIRCDLVSITLKTVIRTKIYSSLDKIKAHITKTG